MHTRPRQQIDPYSRGEPETCSESLFAEMSSSEGVPGTSVSTSAVPPTTSSESHHLLLLLQPLLHLLRQHRMTLPRPPSPAPPTRTSTPPGPPTTSPVSNDRTDASTNIPSPALTSPIDSIHPSSSIAALPSPSDPSPTSHHASAGPGSTVVASPLSEGHSSSPYVVKHSHFLFHC
jgi:hypothetical protein